MTISCLWATGFFFSSILFFSFPHFFISSFLSFLFLLSLVTLSVPLLMVASIVCLTYPISIVLTPVFLSLHFLFPSFFPEVPSSSIQFCVSSLCRRHSVSVRLPVHWSIHASVGSSIGHTLLCCVLKHIQWLIELRARDLWQLALLHFLALWR